MSIQHEHSVKDKVEQGRTHHIIEIREMQEVGELPRSQVGVGSGAA